MNEKEILKIIQADLWMMEILQIVQDLDLPDWWIGAGFVRNKIWDELHGYKKRTPLNDIDVIYFNQKNINENEEKKYEEKLRAKINLPWSVKNQARMAIVRKDIIYQSAEEGLSRWVETATCIGVKINGANHLVLTAPHGIEDLINLVLRPIPLFSKDLQVFNERIKKKQWLKLWPKLKIKISFEL